MPQNSGHININDVELKYDVRTDIQGQLEAVLASYILEVWVTQKWGVSEKSEQESEQL